MSAKSEPWIQATMTGFGQGIRRSETERFVVWVNYVSAGVVSAKQLSFSMEHLTQLCHAHPRSCVGVILLPNRAGDLRSSPKKEDVDMETLALMFVISFSFPDVSTLSTLNLILSFFLGTSSLDP